jgi:hypothetical protein
MKNPLKLTVKPELSLSLIIITKITLKPDFLT